MFVNELLNTNRYMLGILFRAKKYPLNYLIGYLPIQF